MGHGEGEANPIRTILFALAANLAIAIAKLVAFFITSSASMLAEAIHSFADCANQLLLLLGRRLAKRKPDENHPLGYGRDLFFWSFLVAILLFTIGGMFSIYEGVEKLTTHQEELSSPWVAIGVLLFSILAEGISLWGCVREINKARGDKPLWKWYRETRSSELIVVLGEDSAAICGLTLALIAVSVATATGNTKIDAAGSIAIGALLVIVACMTAYQVYHLLLGTSVEVEDRKAINDFISAQPNVTSLLNCITLQNGEDVIVAVKATMREVPSVKELSMNINACEKAIKERFPAVRFVFFEPDIED
ncbi:cation diffusion facilitator family transporter [Hyaloraphidium curvatum]|nr:cation diffusion facilitator family transporter [Hyaloraphidium curvatum]